MDEQMVGPDLVLTTEHEGSRAVVTVRGELDAFSAPRLEEGVVRLVGNGIDEVILDLSATAFLDSSGLRAILTTQRRLRDGDARLVLRSPSEAVTRLLEITGLRDHFSIE